MNLSLATSILPALLLGTVTSMSAGQHVITVDDDRQDLADADFDSLAAAVGQAEALIAEDGNASSVTIEMSPGVYGLVETLEMPVGGLLVIKGVEGAKRTIINASSVDVGIDIQGGMAILEGLTLRTRASSDPRDERIGVHCTDAHLAIEDCIFSSLGSSGDALGFAGTGVFAENSTLHMDGAFFRGYPDAGISLVGCSGGRTHRSMFRDCNVAVHIGQGPDPSAQNHDFLSCAFVGNNAAFLLENHDARGTGGRSGRSSNSWGTADSDRSGTDSESGLRLRVHGCRFANNLMDLWNLREGTAFHDRLLFTDC
jgi:hypothetical protein